MSKIPVLYKTLVIGVIVLFIGIGIQSAIATEEIQEYTLMTPNIFGLKKQKITLTPEHVNKLNCIFDDLQEELQDADSVEEIKLIYKRTIDILVHNGLLSKSDAFQTKKLMFSSIVDRFYSALNKKLNINTGIEGKNCIISGETTNTCLFRPILQRILKLLIGPFHPYRTNPFFADISFGYHYSWDVGSRSYWSNGTISIENNNGPEEYTGKFRGGLSTVNIFGFADYYTFYIGVYCFIGIGYVSLLDDNVDYYMGRAALVDIYEKSSD